MLQNLDPKSLVGLAVCSADWSEIDKRNDLLAPATYQIQRALQITSAGGVVKDIRRDLNLIARTIDSQGMDPVFEPFTSSNFID